MKSPGRFFRRIKNKRKIERKQRNVLRDGGGGGGLGIQGMKEKKCD